MGVDITKLVEFDDLPEGTSDIVYVLGIETFLELVKQCGGGNVYIPSMNSITKKTRNRLIRSEFDGTNIKKLASRFDISDTQIRTILKNSK